MRRGYALLLSLILALFVSSICVAETMELQATQDSYTSATNPDQNYNDELQLRIVTMYIFDFELKTAYIQFDLTPLPENIQITDAYINLWCYEYGPFIDYVLFGANVAEPWSEETITYNNQPPGTGPTIFNEQLDFNYGDIIALPVTEAAQDWYADPASNNGFSIVSDDDDEMETAFSPLN